MTSDPERRYSDEEVATILERALASSSGGTHLPARRETDGITLAQLESVAAEAGIDALRVREAALTLGDESGEEDGSALFGPPASHVFDRVVEGEVPPGRMSDVVAAIRRLTKGTGTVTEVGDWLEWTSGEDRSLHVTVKPEGGRTRLQVVASSALLLAAITVPTGLVTLIAFAVLIKNGLLTTGLGAGLGVAVLAFVRALWELLGRRAGRGYEEFADRLTAEVARLAETPEGVDEPEGGPQRGRPRF